MYPTLPHRRQDAHKGDFGRALLIGGSRGMAGAISLAGMACLRAGAGLVKLAIPECVLETVAGFEPAYMTLPLMADASGFLFPEAAGQLERFVAESTCVAVGPGIGRSAGITKVVELLYRSVSQPLVVDADGLNALASLEAGLNGAGGPRVLTPHPGEFARLAKFTHRTTREEQIATATELAERYNIVLLLKGSPTFITDGKLQHFNATGNPGMATGGTGDVLTGIITALICQNLSPFDAAVLGAHVHGLAGDLAAADLGQVSLIASDLLKYLPRAFQSLAG